MSKKIGFSIQGGWIRSFILPVPALDDPRLEFKNRRLARPRKNVQNDIAKKLSKFQTVDSRFRNYKRCKRTTRNESVIITIVSFYNNLHRIGCSSNNYVLIKWKNQKILNTLARNSFSKICGHWCSVHFEMADALKMFSANILIQLENLRLFPCSIARQSDLSV